MGQYLDQLQTGSVNVQLSDDVGIDWALYAVTVATPKSDPVGAAVFLDGGSVLVDAVIAPIASLAVGGDDGGELTLGQFGRLTINDDYVQTAGGALSIEVGGSNAGQFGKLAVVGQAMLDGDFQIRSVNGFAPSVGAQIEILSAAGGLGGTTFDAPTLVPDRSGDAVWQLIYQPGAVVAQVLLRYRVG